MPICEGGDELSNAVPVLVNPAEMNLAIPGRKHCLKLPIILFRISMVNPLLGNAADPRAEAFAEHGKSGEVALGIAMRIYKVLIRICVRFVVEETI